MIMIFRKQYSKFQDKGMACFECGSLTHLYYSCPELNNREPNVGIMNNLCSDFDLRGLFIPFFEQRKNKR